MFLNIKSRETLLSFFEERNKEGFSTTHPTLSCRVREGFNHSPTLANLWQGLKKIIAETDDYFCPFWYRGTTR